MSRRPLHTRLSIKPTDPDNDFLQLYRQYVERIYRYVMARLGDHAAAEDLTSQVFLEAFKEQDRLAKVENLPAWLFTIARNKLVDSYRRQRGEWSLESLPSLPDETRDPLAQLISDEHQQQLAQALAGLAPDQLEMLQLRYAGELSYRQIGEVVGKSEAAVKMAVHRLLERLQHEMEQSHE